MAANAAVTVSRLGGSATIIGCVGTDQQGLLVLDELRTERVDIHHVRRLHGMPTPESVVISEAGGERTIVGYTPDDISARAAPGLPQGKVDAVLVDARWPDASRAALSLARRINVPGVVDVDRLPVDAARRAILFAQASHLVFSEHALAAATDDADTECGLRRMRTLTNAHLSVTCGDRGVTWLDDDEVRHLDAFDVDVIDTTAAGDVFHGGFTLALAEGSCESAAFRLASAAAAITCSRPDARAGIPSRHEVCEFLSDRPTDGMT